MSRRENQPAYNKELTSKAWNLIRPNEKSRRWQSELEREDHSQRGRRYVDDSGLGSGSLHDAVDAGFRGTANAYVELSDREDDAYEDDYPHRPCESSYATAYKALPHARRSIHKERYHARPRSRRVVSSNERLTPEPAQRGRETDRRYTESLRREEAEKKLQLEELKYKNRYKKLNQSINKLDNDRLDHVEFKVDNGMLFDHDENWDEWVRKNGERFRGDDNDRS
ncbi:hypothetical protein BDV96DRAFT_603498 [Lophiotrema nucula]|uniref:Uncharacterized protein n=1 Tax=Lophiotrema nucula TaxID=690887 RepID=A0A6A5YUU0_9PLEO|nr:hypothetical protein BDV96DRAFT_603498 [Lophiotrema nucula]